MHGSTTLPTSPMALSGQLGEFSLSEILNAVGTTMGRLKLWDLPDGHKLELDLGGGFILACRFNEEPVVEPEDVIEKLCLVATTEVGSYAFRKQSESALEKLSYIPLQATLLEVLVRCDEFMEGQAIYVPADQRLRWDGMSPTTHAPELQFLLRRSAAYLRNGATPQDLARYLGIAVPAARRFCTTLLAEGYLVPVDKPTRTTGESELQKALVSNDAGLEALARSRWFYLDGTNEVGPVAGRQILEAISSGQLPSSVLIWRSDLTRWTPFEEVWLLDREQGGKAAAQAEPKGEQSFGECFVCKERHPLDGMLYYQGWHVCEGCRETFFKELVQKPVGGISMAPPVASLSYRLAAWLIDLAIVAVLTLVLLSLGQAFGLMPFSFIFNLRNVAVAGAVVSLLYHVLVPRFMGRTAGKWALRVRIVDAERFKPVRVDRLIWRWLAGVLPPLYPLAFFQPEHRALHDLAAGTVVVAGPVGRSAKPMAGGLETRLLRSVSILTLTAVTGAIGVLLYRADLRNELRRLADAKPVGADAAKAALVEAQAYQRWQGFLQLDMERAPFFALSEREAEAFVVRTLPFVASADVDFAEREFLCKLSIPLHELPFPLPSVEGRFLNVELRCTIENVYGGFRVRVQGARCHGEEARGLLLKAIARAADHYLQRELQRRKMSFQAIARVVPMQGVLEFRR